MCVTWARSGQCKVNPAFMAVNCRRSCEICTPSASPGASCADSFKDCRSMAREDGACGTEFMQQSCRLTCG
eukprot:907952-Prymnesium_polylepis.1